MTPLTVTQATQDHLDGILGIERLSFSNPWSRESFASTLNRPDINTVLTALENGTPIGYVCLFHLFEEGEILNIAVHPDYRKNGVAQTLIDRAFDLFKEKNVNRVTLEVRISNENAKNLYIKNGFEPFLIRKNYYSSPTEDGIIMQKHL